jgi:hypothetical protein
MTQTTEPRNISLILPSDPFWLLRVGVKHGDATPFNLVMLWHWQWMLPRGLDS